MNKIIRLRSLISSILVVSLLNLAGCYSIEQVTAQNYNQVVEEEGKPKAIYVKTKDAQEYQYCKLNFLVENDSLVGIETFYLDEGEEVIDRKFSFSDIDYIEFEYFDLGTTILAIAIPLTLIYLWFSNIPLFPKRN